MQEEVNKKKTGLRWKAKKPRNLKFVHDGLTISKMNMDSAAVSGRVKCKHDILTQNIFRRITSKAESRGMVVNKKKTKIVCMSDAQTYHATCMIEDCDGQVLRSGPGMKILGFHIDSRPSVHAHIDALKIRMRDTAWVLRHLKIAGFTEMELATVYRTVVRPVLDYLSLIHI